jgi:DNA-binding MarR family transcriptional regulator
MPPATMSVGVTELVEQIDAALIHLVRRASLPRTHDTFARESGVSIDRGALIVLARLCDLGPIRPSELARLLSVEPSTVTRHVQDLGRRSLVAKRPDPTDGRSCVIELTAEGRRTLERYRTVRRRMLAAVLSDWEPDELAHLATSLDRLVLDLDRLTEVRESR